MDRNDRIAVIGTWARHAKPPQDNHVPVNDPRGWASHHPTHSEAHGHMLAPSELVEAIRARAYELFLKRAKFGHAASPVQDWLQAESEVMAQQVSCARGQGDHPAVPGRCTCHR